MASADRPDDFKAGPFRDRLTRQMNSRSTTVCLLVPRYWGTRLLAGRPLVAGSGLTDRPRVPRAARACRVPRLYGRPRGRASRPATNGTAWWLVASPVCTHVVVVTHDWAAVNLGLLSLPVPFHHGSSARDRQHGPAQWITRDSMAKLAQLAGCGAGRRRRLQATGARCASGA